MDLRRCGSLSNPSIDVVRLLEWIIKDRSSPCSTGGLRGMCMGGRDLGLGLGLQDRERLLPLEKSTPGDSCLQLRCRERLRDRKFLEDRSTGDNTVCSS